MGWPWSPVGSTRRGRWCECLLHVLGVWLGIDDFWCLLAHSYPEPFQCVFKPRSEAAIALIRASTFDAE